MAQQSGHVAAGDLSPAPTQWHTAICNYGSKVLFCPPRALHTWRTDINAGKTLVHEGKCNKSCSLCTSHGSWTVAPALINEASPYSKWSHRRKPQLDTGRDQQIVWSPAATDTTTSQVPASVSQGRSQKRDRKIRRTRKP